MTSQNSLTTMEARALLICSYHYQKWQKENVKNLKKEGKYTEAIDALLTCVASTEITRIGGVVAPWPYEQLAIVYRKIKDYDRERMILERFMEKSHFPMASEKLYDRLLKAYKREGNLEYVDEVPFHKEKGVPVDSLDMFLPVGAIVDTETTGISRDDEVIELAIILFRFNKRTGVIIKVLDEYCDLREPTCGMNPIALKKHGIEVSELEGRCLDEKCVLNMFKKADLLFAHNAPFDRKHVADLFPEVLNKDWYCTLNGVQWRKKGFSSGKLSDLLEEHGIERDRTHRALHDAKAILELISQTDKTTGEPYLLEMLGRKYDSVKRKRRKAQFKRWCNP